MTASHFTLFFLIFEDKIFVIFKTIQNAIQKDFQSFFFLHVLDGLIFFL